MLYLFIAAPGFRFSLTFPGSPGGNPTLFMTKKKKRQDCPNIYGEIMVKSNPISSLNLPNSAKALNIRESLPLL